MATTSTDCPGSWRPVPSKWPGDPVPCEINWAHIASVRSGKVAGKPFMHKLMRKHAAGKKRRALAPKPPDPRDLKRLGKALAARRHKVGLTQNELVLLTGFKSEYISLIERGGRNPPYTTLLAIARALKTKVARLVPD